MRLYKKEYLNTCSECGEKYVRDIDRDRCESSHLEPLKSSRIRKKFIGLSEAQIKRKENCSRYYDKNSKEIKERRVAKYKRDKLEQKRKNDEDNI